MQHAFKALAEKKATYGNSCTKQAAKKWRKGKNQSEKLKNYNRLTNAHAIN